MIDLSDKSQLLSYLKSNGLWAKHGLGQNFLADRTVLEKIVDAADLNNDDFVVEVGPGLGTLTEELLKKAQITVAIELDRKLADLLENKFSNDVNLRVINADILKVNIPEIVGNKKYKVIANIPYYITSKIIKLFLTMPNKPESIVLLVQKEVAERICAKAGDMSILALSVQVYGEPQIIDIVPRDSFFPAPDVDSAVLKISKIGYKMSEIDEEILFRNIKFGFASRRKTLVNNFSAAYKLDKKIISDIIELIGINPSARAEELSLDDWARLSKAFLKY